MSLSRMRWAMATLLAAVGFISAMGALRTYAAHGLVLGVLSVLVLAAITVAGMASLAVARRRIGEELKGLLATPPAGGLFMQRRRRLEAIKGSGARPDHRALAEATSAHEASRAYLGRYFVATTVLVGLVGTFAGLMETIGKVAPLLSDEGGALNLLAAPLAGLNVTFGASLVAIIVTLALSLAQGDLVLHEEQALAALEDLTHHTLVPELWPPTLDANERTVRALEGLHTQIAQAVVGAFEQATETLNRTQDERLTALAQQLASGADATALAVKHHTTDTAATLAKTAANVEAQLAKVAEVLSDRLSETTQQQLLQVNQAVAQVSASLTRGTESVMSSLQGELRATNKAISRQAEDAIAQSGLVAEQMSTELKHTFAAAGTELAKAGEHHRILVTELIKATQAQSRDVSQQLVATFTDFKLSFETETRATLTHTANAVAQATQALAHNLAPVFETESQERKHVGAALASTLEGLRDVVAKVDQQTQSLERQSHDQSETLKTVGQNVVAALTATATEQTKVLADLSVQTAQKLEAIAAGTNQTMSEAAVRAIEAFTASTNHADEARAAAEQRWLQALAEAQSQQTEAMGSVSTQVVQALGETTLRNGQNLQAAAEKLMQAAQGLDATLTPLQPRLDALTTELERLTHEVALMAAQSDATHGSAVVLAELERVGDGLERLASLVRLAREPEAAEIQEAHS